MHDRRSSIDDLQVPWDPLLVNDKPGRLLDMMMMIMMMVMMIMMEMMISLMIVNIMMIDNDDE